MSKSPDLGVRTATGVLLIVGASLLVYFGGGPGTSSATVSFIGGWAFRIAVALIAAGMLLEWNVIHQLNLVAGRIAAAILALLLLFLAEALFPIIDIHQVLTSTRFVPGLAAFGVIAIAGLALAAVLRRASVGIGIVYVGIPAFSLLALEWGWERLTFWAMIITWTTDIGAYFAGRTIGGPKLAPLISPNKTWAGLIGGMAGAAIIGWICAFALGLGGIFLLLGAPMAALAQAGDLFESWIKRRAGVKDSGSILPGHGGLLDRLDGLLPVAVATLLLLMAGYWVQ